MENIGILKKALPYIKRYKNKIFVVKLGGEIIQDNNILDGIAQDISFLYQIGIKIILIHGGGPQATELSKKLGISPKIVEGRRVTNKETLEVVKMVFAGKVNHEILTILRKYGAKSVGLSGIDGDIIIAKKRDPVEYVNKKTGEVENIDFGHVGDIIKINTGLIEVLLDNNYIPVISSLADDGEGHILNINADTIASRVSAAVHSYKYINMTSVNGILSDPDDPESNIPSISKKEALRMIKDSTIQGGMVPKISEIIHAIDRGVKRVHVLNGTVKSSLLMVTFTGKGHGTIFLPDGKIEE